MPPNTGVEPKLQSGVEDGADVVAELVDVVGLLEKPEAAVLQHALAFLVVAVTAGDNELRARLSSTQPARVLGTVFPGDTGAA